MVKIPDIQFANTGLRSDTAFQTPTQADTGITDFAGAAFKGLDEATQRIRSREDTVNRIRTVDKFKQDAFDSFSRSQVEMDLTDPETVKTFNQQMRQKASDYLKNFKGSSDARAQVESELGNILTSYTTQMTANSITAQRQFVMKKAGDQINQLSAQIVQNPAYLPEALKQLGVIIKDVSPAIYAEDEISLMSAAQEQLSVTALQTYTDAGQYEEARDLINKNPFFMQSMSPESQKSILREIQGGIAARDKVQKETRQKINTIKSAAQELGVELSGNDVFTAVTGIESKKDPQDKIDEFSRLTNQDPATLSPSVVAKIAYGVDLPGATEIDMNKERLPDGGYTPKGISVLVKPRFDMAAATKVNLEKILAQSKEFTETGNKQSGIAVQYSFQKLLDETSAVREGELALSAQGNSALDNLQLMMDRITEGGTATPEQVRQMTESAKVLAQSVLEATKRDIDPYLEEAAKKGYRMIDIGLPRESYDNVFRGVKTPVDRKADKLQTIQNIAKQNGLSMEELLQSTAAVSGKTIEQVKKDFEID